MLWFKIFYYFSTIALFVRLVFLKFKISHFNTKHLAVYTYISVLFGNSLGYIFLGSTGLMYYYYHSFAPFSIITSLLFIKLIKPQWLIIISVSGSLLIWFYSSYFVFFIMYVTAMILLLIKAREETKGNRNDVCNSYIPILISIDLLISFISVILKKSGMDWDKSQYIGYTKYIVMPFFIILNTFLHVNLRRLSIN